MITKWNFQTPSEEELHKRDKLASELGLSPVVCLLLVQRGLTTVEEVKKFFKPSLNDLHDPFLMPDMEKAVKRLNKALGNKEKILIYGDYDVDGTTAVSLVYKYLRPYSSTLDFYIPDRYDEGYGISYKGINYAQENGITLVISPLISLMKDQVESLNQAGIHAAYLNSSLTVNQYYKALSLARNGRNPIIYVAPERLLSPEFLNFACHVKISMVAVA